MEQFSKSWLSSKTPKKQRKYRFNAPLHRKNAMLSATLSKNLRTEHKKRSLPLRQGDSVKIMRGDFRGQVGKINIISLRNLKVTLDSVSRKKANGSVASVFFDPSNLMITELKKDSRRFNKKSKQHEKKVDQKKTEVKK